MLEIALVLEEKHFTDTRAMTKVLARCLRCNSIVTMVKQNVTRHNRLGRTHCSVCVSDKYHRQTGTRMWRIWMGMKTRTKGTGHEKDRKNYSDRGIRLCQEWESFKRFYEDMRDGYSDDLTIERIDVNGPYSKQNCRWASLTEQQANKRNNRLITYQGEQIHLAEFCRRIGMSRGKVTSYLNQGVTGDEAAQAARESRYNQGMPRKARFTTS